MFAWDNNFISAAYGEQSYRLLYINSVMYWRSKHACLQYMYWRCMNTHLHWLHVLKTYNTDVATVHIYTQSNHVLCTYHAHMQKQCTCICTVYPYFYAHIMHTHRSDAYIYTVYSYAHIMQCSRQQWLTSWNRGHWQSSDSNVLDCPKDLLPNHHAKERS